MRLVMRNLSGYLRQKRIESGLSQFEVAKVLGYSSPQFVSNWERGLVSPPLETMSVLIELYKMSSHDVIDKIIDETKDYLEANLVKRKKPRGRRNAS